MMTTERRRTGADQTGARRSSVDLPGAELRVLLDHLREPVVLAGADRVISFCNVAAEQMLGAARHELVGRPMVDVLPGWPGTAEQPVADWRVEPLGRGYAAFGDATADTRWMQRMLQAEQLAAVGQLAASVAHEVGAPLTAITVVVDQLLAHSCGACTKGSHDLEIVLSQARRIAQLSRRLVDLARPGDPLRRPIDFNSCITEAFELVEKQLRRNEIRTTLTLDPAVSIIQADPHQVQQLLINLMLNAGSAMRETAGRIDVVTCLRGAWVELVVADTGPGISADDLPRIFLPFFSRSGGTGLGLPLSRQIVHAHGGTIDVDSTPGTGTHFTVRIPVRHE